MRARTAIGGGLAITFSIAIAVVAEAAPASNDDIANAETYTTPRVEQPFSTIDATLEAGEADCTGDSNTVWFSFTAPSAGEWVAYLTGSDHDTILDWSENLATSEGVCNDDAADSYDATTNSKFLGAGEQEFIQVGTVSNGEWGSGSLGVVERGNAHNSFDSARPLTFATVGAPSAVDAVQFISSETAETGESTGCGPNDLGECLGMVELHGARGRHMDDRVQVHNRHNAGCVFR